MKKYIFLLLILFLFHSDAAYAQSLGNAGTIDVIAVDQTGAVVPNAAAELRNPLSGYTRTERTDNAGKCAFTNVPPNQYHLEVKASGFSAFDQDVTVRTTVPISVQATTSAFFSASTAGGSIAEAGALLTGGAGVGAGVDAAAASLADIILILSALSWREARAGSWPSGIIVSK